jgi:hypothetical protein
VTWLTTVACMRDWFTHVCNNNQLIILAKKETYLGVRLLEASLFAVIALFGSLSLN